MNIKWDEAAKQQIIEIFKFNQAEFGTKKAILIVQSIKQHVSLLKKFPFMGAVDECTLTREKPYRYLVEKHCKIYYTIETDFIFIALIWNTRQDPKRLLQHFK